MSDLKERGELTKGEVETIKEQAKRELENCGKMTDIIGTQIFPILTRYARVIYYPLGTDKDDPWGFTRIQGNVSKEEKKPFVVINTSIPTDCRVFAAAHELYHICYEKKTGEVPADVMDDKQQNRDELRANRFAAEFLAPEKLLRQELQFYGITKDCVDIKTILQMAEAFCIPYRAMVKRLYEIGEISNEQKTQLLEKSKADVEIARRRYSLPVPGADERIAIDNLVELAVEAYSKRLITYERLEYLLEFDNLTPAAVGIKAPKAYTPPSDDELDHLMEE